MKAADQFGNGVSAVGVTWQVTSGSATVNPMSSTSDATGIAQTTVTLGGTAGPISITATSTGLTGSPLTFQATATTLPASASVTIQDFSFSPSTLTIKVGTSVKWTNNGPSSHTTTSDSGVWDSGTLSAPSGGGGYGGGTAGGTYQFTFTTPGTYNYHCKIHPPSSYPGFTGTITVTQ